MKKQGSALLLVLFLMAILTAITHPFLHQAHLFFQLSFARLKEYQQVWATKAALRALVYTIEHTGLDKKITTPVSLNFYLPYTQGKNMTNNVTIEPDDTHWKVHVTMNFDQSLPVRQAQMMLAVVKNENKTTVELKEWNIYSV